MTTMRSQGWSVRPSFVANGPTSPVTLLGDESGLTQLAGDPAVAWQTPWSELRHVELVRFSRTVALFATVDGVRYCWRKHDPGDYEELRAVVVEHGGSVLRRRRRAGVAAVAVVVALASFAGGFAAWLNTKSPAAKELASARAVNLTLNDLPSVWGPSGSVSYLAAIFPSASQVITSTTRAGTTTTVAPNSTWGKVTSLFQRCLSVSNVRDRVYGAAGQMPDYQVTSKVFDASSFGGIEVASTAQYYRTTTMVRRDTAEMSKADFGSCFVTSNAALIDAALSEPLPTSNVGTNWQPLTYVSGWSRGGVASLAAPGVTSSLHLVMVEATSGHYEVTMGALVGSWPQSESFLSNLVDTLLARMKSSTARAA